MSKIKILAGDFPSGEVYQYGDNSLWLTTNDPKYKGEEVPYSFVETAEVATEENVKKLGGTVGWGAVGALTLGPVGLLAGLLLGGKKKEITFIAKLKDGRKLMAVTDSKTWGALQAALF